MEYLGNFLNDWVETFSQEEDIQSIIKDEDSLLACEVPDESDDEEIDASDYVPSWERPELKNFQTFCGI